MAVVWAQVAFSTGPSTSLEEVDGCHCLLVLSVRAALCMLPSVSLEAVDRGQSVLALSVVAVPSRWCQVLVPLCCLPRMAEAEAELNSRVPVRCTARA